MNFLKTIIFIGLAVHLINCGGQSHNESTVKVAKVENGVPKTEDGRIVLSSQAEDNSLVMPEGTCENCIISSQKLGMEIAQEFESVSEVYDISLDSDLYAVEVIDTVFIFGLFDDRLDRFSISFTVKTISGAIYENIECTATTPNQATLYLRDCESDQVALDTSIHIKFNKILIDDSNRARELID